jgi:hypothetical protein
MPEAPADGMQFPINLNEWDLPPNAWFIQTIKASANGNGPFGVPTGTWVNFCQELEIPEIQNNSLVMNNSLDDPTRCFYDRFFLFVTYNSGTGCDAIPYDINTPLGNVRFDNLSLTPIDGINRQVHAGPFCLGSPINLIPPNVFYGVGIPTDGVWSGANVTQAGGGYIFSPVNPGQHILYYRNAPGAACRFDFTVLVNVKEQPSAFAGTDKSICLSYGKQLLQGTPSGGIWSGNGVLFENNQYYFDPLAPNVTLGNGGNSLTYSLAGGAGSCPSQDEVWYSVFGAQGEIGPNKDICLGESATVKFSGISSPDAIFNWAVNGSSPLQYTVNPPFSQLDPAPYQEYTITPGSVGPLYITLNVTDPNARQVFRVAQ